LTVQGKRKEEKKNWGRKGKNRGPIADRDLVKREWRWGSNGSSQLSEGEKEPVSNCPEKGHGSVGQAPFKAKGSKRAKEIG